MVDGTGTTAASTTLVRKICTVPLQLLVVSALRTKSRGQRTQDGPDSIISTRLGLIGPLFDTAQVDNQATNTARNGLEHYYY